jgi:hypothetical protein
LSNRKSAQNVSRDVEFSRRSRIGVDDTINYSIERVNFPIFLNTILKFLLVRLTLNLLMINGRRAYCFGRMLAISAVFPSSAQNGFFFECGDLY